MGVKKIQSPTDTASEDFEERYKRAIKKCFEINKETEHLSDIHSHEMRFLVKKITETPITTLTEYDDLVFMLEELKKLPEKRIKEYVEQAEELKRKINERDFVGQEPEDKTPDLTVRGTPRIRRPKGSEDDLIKVGGLVPNDLRERFVAYAAAHETTQSKVITQALQEFLQKYEA